MVIVSEVVDVVVRVVVDHVGPVAAAVLLLLLLAVVVVVVAAGAVITVTAGVVGGGGGGGGVGGVVGAGGDVGVVSAVDVVITAAAAAVIDDVGFEQALHVDIPSVGRVAAAVAAGAVAAAVAVDVVVVAGGGGGGGAAAAAAAAVDRPIMRVGHQNAPVMTVLLEQSHPSHRLSRTSEREGSVGVVCVPLSPRGIKVPLQPRREPPQRDVASVTSVTLHDRQES